MSSAFLVVVIRSLPHRLLHILCPCREAGSGENGYWSSWIFWLKLLCSEDILHEFHPFNGKLYLGKIVLLTKCPYVRGFCVVFCRTTDTTTPHVKPSINCIKNYFRHWLQSGLNVNLKHQRAWRFSKREKCVKTIVFDIIVHNNNVLLNTLHIGWIDIYSF